MISRIEGMLYIRQMGVMARESDKYINIQMLYL